MGWYKSTIPRLVINFSGERVVAGKFSLAIGLGFCWVAPARRWGNFNFLILTQNSIFNLVLGALLAGDHLRFLK